MIEDTNLKTLENKVLAKLKLQMENSEDFQNEIEYLTFFYGRKLMSFVKSEEDKLFIDNNFPDVLSSQYFQGYYTMSFILQDKDVDFDNNDFSTFSGRTRNEIPIFLKNTMDQQDIDWTYTESGHKFSMNILDFMQNAYEITKQIRLDIANYGAYKAFIEDERYQHKVPDPSFSVRLGNPFDIEFISPQVYMQCQFLKDDVSEVWDLFMWSSVGDGKLVGSINLSQMDTGSSKYFLVEYKLTNLITKDEKMDIVNFVTTRLPSDVKSLLQTRLYHVEDIDILAFNDNPQRNE